MDYKTSGIRKIENIFENIPVPVFVVDDDVVIYALNDSATLFGGKDRTHYYNKKGGDAFGCVNSFEKPEGCGHGSVCSDCIIRNSMKAAINNNRVVRKLHKLEMVSDSGKKSAVDLLVSSSPVADGDRTFAVLTIEDITELINLRDLIPICAGCKKVRNDKDYWQSVEEYFHKSIDAQFSHGICPECIQELYPEIAEAMKSEQPAE